MLRFSRFKADSNKLIHQIIKPANFKSKFPMNYLIKKNFCIKVTNKISERLSFLNTEEDMRKYFNIVDHDKKDADIIFNEELKTQQEIFLETQKEFDSFDRKKLLEFIINLDPNYKLMKKKIVKKIILKLRMNIHFL